CSVSTQESPVHGQPIERPRAVVKLSPGLGDRAGEARILGSRLAVDVGRHIPGLLVGQLAALSISAMPAPQLKERSPHGGGTTVESPALWPAPFTPWHILPLAA